MSWGVATQNGVSVSLASIVSLSCGATEFSPASLFTSGVAGAWYDPSDINNYTAELGAELVTPDANRDFSSDTGYWTKTGTTAISGGVCNIVGNTNQGINSNNLTTLGGFYQLQFEITRVGSGSVYALAGTNGTAAFNTVGVKQAIVQAANNRQIRFWAGSASTDIDIDNISVKEVTGIANATLFQDSAGTTPVTAVEQPVGLMLDKSQGLVLGSELVTNGDFSVGTGWSTGGVWVISGGVASITSSTAALSQSTLAAVVGTWYQVTFTISAFTAGGVRVEFGGVNGASRTAAGTYTQYILATSTSFLVISPVATSTLSIDNVSIKVIAGNHARAPNDPSRPMLRARYNLLTYSEQFDNAAWFAGSTTVSANQATAPDGTVTADLVYVATTGASRYIWRTASVFTVTAQVITSSFYVKASSWTWVMVNGTGTNAGVWFNISTGQKGTESAGYTGTITDAGSGWWRVTVTETRTGAVQPTVFLADANNSLTATASGTNGVYLWGAQLVYGSSAGTYQRIAAATDYATAGFLPYLYFVTDDSFGTNSIDFTATDKMSVCAGVTKLSDAATAIFVELSDNSNNNSGVVALTAPLSASERYSWVSKGTAITSILTTSSSYNAPVTNVITGLGDISGDLSTLRINATQIAQTTADQGTGNFGNYPLFIGRRNNATFPFNGNFYQLVVCGKALSASELASTEAYVATKTGVTL